MSLNCCFFKRFASGGHEGDIALCGVKCRNRASVCVRSCMVIIKVLCTQSLYVFKYITVAGEMCLNGGHLFE